MFDVVRPHRRRGARRVFRTRCQAVRMDDLVLVGDRILDLSPRGALIACDEEMAVGEELMISLRTPWLGPHVVMLAVVTRVIEGWRQGDPGYAVGVRFIEQDAAIRHELAQRLRPFPVVPANRTYPADYAETVRRVQLTA